jgi:H+/Cl- antiporter ClcA
MNTVNILKTIKNKFKSRFDRITNERVRVNILNAFPFWLGAFISGATAVLFAYLFSLAEYGSVYFFKKAGWSFFIITPACFVIAYMIVEKYAPFARGSGIPQVSAAIELSNPKHHYKVNALLGLRVIIVKFFSCLIMVFGGGAIGREGPTIQISASIFKKINDILPAWYPKISKRNMIVTGAAAGLAAAFNTPLGGIVFAIEELTKTHFSFFKSALLTGVIIAGLTALNFLGPYLYLGYPQLNGISKWIILPILLLSIIVGLAGSIMGKIILAILNWKKRINNKYLKVTYVILCGLVIALAALFIDYRVLGSGKEIMVSALFTENKQVEWYIPVLRIFGPIISFSTGSAGGIFAPSLSAGASIGGAIAGWFHLTATDTNLLILCGMTGFLTSITRSPFTSSILVLEMTNSHNVIFYIMLTALLANLIAQAVTRHSFYDHLKVQYVNEIHKSNIQEAASPLPDPGLTGTLSG